MARVKITAYANVEDDQVDPGDSTGLTEEGYDEVMEMLVGLEDVRIEPT